MTKTIDLADKIEKQLPAELVGFMQTAARVSDEQGQRLYLVGGIVRDLLLGRSNLDIDLVVEGDALNLAQHLAMMTQGETVVHRRFRTAKLQWNKWSVDLITARSETYDRPGALPKVKSGPLAEDLFRRDFTINAMAVELTPGHYGQLIDLHDGLKDLEDRLIRILHKKSFIDDATRMLRGLRYEQRLGFQLEPTTLQLLKRDIPMLDTISGDRIRHELELILKEEFPEKTLCRAQEVGVLSRLYPALKCDHWLIEKFEQARKISPDLPSVELYLTLLAYRLTDEETESLISQLRLPRSPAQTMRDIKSLKAELSSLADPNAAPSHIYKLLRGHSPSALAAISLAGDSAMATKHIQSFLTRLRYIRPSLTGSDLQRMGVAPGPRIKEILERLHEARLDGKVTSKEREIELVKGWLVN
jgi:tRNA nucleotidyltransferase (CCA-adding enzyme)